MGIEEQISQYCEKKEESGVLSKELKALSADIKQYLVEHKATAKEVGEWEVRLQTKVTEDFDMTKLICVLKKYWEYEHEGEPCPFVTTVEVIDENALEGALYRDELPQEVIEKIDGCRIKKETTALVYKKVKEK